MISGSAKQQVARRASHKPFSSTTVRVSSRVCTRASRSSSTRQSNSIQTASPLAEGPQATITQRLFSAALAASVLLSSGTAFAIGPVSVKLEDLQVAKTDCGGELYLCDWAACTTGCQSAREHRHIFVTNNNQYWWPCTDHDTNCEPIECFWDCTRGTAANGLVDGTGGHQNGMYPACQALLVLHACALCDKQCIG